MNRDQRTRDWLVAAVGPALAATLGSIATFRSVDTWYTRLRKPSWNPPRSVFGPVWTLLYIMMAIAELRVTRSRKPDVQAAQTINRVQLALNAGWSIVFFGCRAPGAALAVIVALWLAIVDTIRRYRSIDPVASAMLVPYLCWTTFASALNAAIWWKNRGRSRV